MLAEPLEVGGALRGDETWPGAAGKGFALQEAGLPFDGPDTVAHVAGPIMERFATGDYPHMVEMATEFYFRPGYDFGAEFDFCLDLVLDGLARSLPPDGA